MDERDRRQGPARGAGLQDRQVQGRRELLRDLRHQQGRQEGRDLLRHQVARYREGRSREVRPMASRQPVWDPVVRLLHWVLAALVVIDLVRDEGDYPHRLVGYAAVAVVLARLVWGLVCRPPGRLSGLLPSVSQSVAYLRLLRRG